MLERRHGLGKVFYRLIKESLFGIDPFEKSHHDNFLYIFLNADVNDVLKNVNNVQLQLVFFSKWSGFMSAVLSTSCPLA